MKSLGQMAPSSANAFQHELLSPEVLGDLRSEPCVHFSLHPGDTLRRELHAHRKVSLRLQLIDLRFPQSGERKHLSDAQHASRRVAPVLVIPAVKTVRAPGVSSNAARAAALANLARER
jgi:hypothetical protein